MSGARQNTRPSAEDQRKGAEGWLNSEGFPLEMRVAKTLSESGRLNVYQGEYYADPITGEPRENDIYTVDVVDSGWAGIAIFTVNIIECTYTENPWVVFPISPQSPILHGQPLPPPLSEPAKHLHEAILSLSTEAGGVIPRIYRLPDPVSYSIRTKEKASNGKGDAAYRKTSELLAATEARLRLAKQHGRWELLVPIVVIDGELFSAGLDGNGRIIVTPTKGVATVLSGVSGVPIRIVTEAALKGFCQDQATDIADLRDHAKEFVEKATSIANAKAMARFT